VSRAIFEKHSLARAAETITQELAQTDAQNEGDSWTVGSNDARRAIADANRQANLGLSTVWTQPPPVDRVTNPAQKFNPADDSCDQLAGLNDDPCQSAANQDGSVMIIGYPDLQAPLTIKVTVSQPYRSFIGFPLPLLGGNAAETVAATTLIGQQQQQ
jgi:hypothetical protein